MPLLVTKIGVGLVIARPRGSRVKVSPPVFLNFIFIVIEVRCACGHGVPEIEMNDDCFHAESAVARRNAALNADILRQLRN